MLAGHKLILLNDLIAALDKEELLWAHGYIAGRIAGTEPVAAPVNVPVSSSQKITIAYGTETGNSKKLALDLAARAKKQGVHVKPVSLEQYRLNDLAKEEYFITVISTQGEGEPPLGAKKFYDHLFNNGFQVPAMKYAVLGLGDTSYPMFCKTGEDVDHQLEALGAKRVYPLKKCDLDYEAAAIEWFDELLSSINNNGQSAAAPIITKAPEAPKKAGNKIIYRGKIIRHINLNAEGSAKETFHIEMDVPGIDYLPGDSIGIVPQNDVSIVNEIISLGNLNAEKNVAFKNETASLRELLLNKININFLLEKFVIQYGVLTGHAFQSKRHNLVELLRTEVPVDQQQLETFILSLHAVAPRIYNITSAKQAHGEEVHILALKDQYTIDGKASTGLCSAFLEDKKPGVEISFFVQANKRFRLPGNERDIIMIGPGTGIAPYRSFLSERDTAAASGRSWLFFAEDDFTTDFYYQTEWQNWFSTGVLTHISLAFKNSEDAAKTVSEKIKQQSQQLFEWINGGAFIYLCGEKDPMSREAEEALLYVIEREGHMNRIAALEYFETLKMGGRYMKDVY